MSSVMKISIAGAGAMGSLFAYFFVKAGIAVSIYEINPRVVGKLKDGLHVLIANRSEKLTVEVSDSPETVRGAAIVFMFVKSYSTLKAMEQIRHFISRDTIIVSLQNGIGNKEVITGFVPEGKIVYGSTTIGAAKNNEGVVIYGGAGDISLGGRDENSVSDAASVLRQAGLTVSISPDPDAVVWKKAVINAGINPLGALLGITNGKIIENEHTAAVQERLVLEGVSVARGAGIDLDPDALVRTTRDVCRSTSSNRCSMLQDLESGRRTEIDNINGIIVALGHEYDLPVPVNETLYNLIKSREQF